MVSEVMTTDMHTRARAGAGARAISLSRPAAQHAGAFDPAASVAANAVASWRFEDTNIVQADATGRGNDIAHSNLFEDPTYVAGKVGLAWDSPGVGDTFSRASGSDLQIGAGDFIVATWVKTRDPNADQFIVSKSSEYVLSFLSGGLCFGAGDGAGVVFSSVTPVADTWYLLVAWYDRANGVFHLRVNDSPADSGPQEDVVGTGGSAGLYVGSSGGEGRFFDGLIDETLLVKPAAPLSSDDFDALCEYLYNSGAGRDLSSLF